jgi:hypothetical protein
MTNKMRIWALVCVVILVAGITLSPLAWGALAGSVGLLVRD